MGVHIRGSELDFEKSQRSSPLLFNNLPMIRNRETDIFERFIIIEKVKNDRAKKGNEKLWKHL